MTTTQVVSALLAATLLFWAVGAYNRLVRLRGEIHQRFAAVQEQLAQRHALLLRWIESIGPWLDHDPDVLPALSGACETVHQAVDRVAQRPSAAKAAAALRAAEEALAAARARAVADMPAQVDRILPTAKALGGADGGMAMPVLAEELTAAGGTLLLARQQFNEAVEDYNDAMAQFPTWIMAGLFHFRAAGML